MEAARVADCAAWAGDLAALQRVLGARVIEPDSAPLRVVASLVSFVDDHRRPVPGELFPVRGVRAFLQAIAQRAPSTLTPPEQMEIALTTVSDAWQALLVCHFALRQLARARDARALGASVPADIPSRCALAVAIAPFHEALSAGGDPLGDTYHYWANVIAGVVAVRTHGLGGLAIAALFCSGPTLMRLVRETIFGSYLFYGAHQRIDRLGLRHGIALASARGQRRTWWRATASTT